MTNILISFFLSIFSGASLYAILILINQRWVKNFHYAMVFLTLPLIAFIITKVISGNIALSLGMIGALSIIRFRNPVKSPFELVMFFALLTLGISFSVSIKWGLLLITSLIFVIVFIKTISYFISKKGITFFNLSFDETFDGSELECISKTKIKMLETESSLYQYIFSKDEEKYIYKNLFKDQNKLNSIVKELEGNKDIISIEIRKNNAFF
jgi:uncharacterized integral membrane protein